jgi:trans-aconitate 2-methyltransferase
VLEWYSGSGLRPHFDVLGPEELIEFRADVATVFREVYPRRSYGTLFPFRRVFVVAQA